MGSEGISVKDYLADPCGASSLPYWKTERIVVPENLRIMKGESSLPFCEGDEPYFKLMHDLKTLMEPRLPEGCRITQPGVDGFAKHICSCYTKEGVTAEELFSYQTRFVYRPELWIAVEEASGRRTVATGIAELDPRIGEGILEWIQVSPECRRKGLGTYLVCELLKRMTGSADFVTVSGRVGNESRPDALYRACGFGNPVIWHVITG